MAYLYSDILASFVLIRTWLPKGEFQVSKLTLRVTEVSFLGFCLGMSLILLLLPFCRCTSKLKVV